MCRRNIFFEQIDHLVFVEGLLLPVNSEQVRHCPWAAERHTPQKHRGLVRGCNDALRAQLSLVIKAAGCTTLPRENIYD